MSNLRVIDPRPTRVDPEVVRILENTLEKARAGEVVGIVFIDQSADGTASYTIAGIKDRFSITGYVFHMLYRLQFDKD